jgi:hypothetical protein
MEFVKVCDPDKPGDYLVLSKDDFDKSKHRLFEDEAPRGRGAGDQAEKAKPAKRRA